MPFAHRRSLRQDLHATRPIRRGAFRRSCHVSSWNATGKEAVVACPDSNRSLAISRDSASRRGRQFGHSHCSRRRTLAFCQDSCCVRRRLSALGWVDVHRISSQQTTCSCNGAFVPGLRLLPLRPPHPHLPRVRPFTARVEISPRTAAERRHFVARGVSPGISACNPPEPRRGAIAGTVIQTQTAGRTECHTS